MSLVRPQGGVTQELCGSQRWHIRWAAGGFLGCGRKLSEAQVGPSSGCGFCLWRTTLSPDPHSGFTRMTPGFLFTTAPGGSCLVAGHPAECRGHHLARQIPTHSSVRLLPRPPITLTLASGRSLMRKRFLLKLSLRTLAQLKALIFVTP